MVLLVLLGSGLLLASVTALDQRLLQLVLLALFLSTGLLFRYKVFAAYLLFIFLYPLLPSQAVHLSPFDFLEYFFLCFAFWWAFDRVRNKRWRLPQSRINLVL